MVAFPIGIGGDMTPNAPQRGKLSGDQSWREPPMIRTRGAPSGIDWEKDPKYFTPQPGPKVHYGARHDILNDLPQPVEKKINVKAIPPATTYTADGLPIPSDRWETVTMSPHILHAIKEGDLERGPDPEGHEESQRASPPPRREGVSRRHEPSGMGERRHHQTPPPEAPAE